MSRPIGQLVWERVVAFGAREIDNDLLGLVVLLADLASEGAVGMEQLVRDVRQNGGAAGRDAAFGDEDQQPGEELLDVSGRLELRGLGEEVGGEILGVRLGGRRAGMTETKTGAGVQNGKTTLAAIDGVVAAA